MCLKVPYWMFIIHHKALTKIIILHDYIIQPLDHQLRVFLNNPLITALK